MPRAATWWAVASPASVAAPTTWLVTYSRGGAGGGASFDRPGRVATFAGNDGDTPSWTYGAPAETSPGREAWMLGGGDDSTVVYANPATRR